MKRLLILPLLLTLSCTKIYTQPSATINADGTPAPTVVKPSDVIEYRVFGTNLTGTVTVRYLDSINGSVTVTTTAPYLATTRSTDDSIFLFIQADGAGTQFTSTLQVQIFVNGKLFREATTQGFTLSTSVSGTFRR